MAHMEISVKGVQVRFYGKHADNYDCSFCGHKEDRLLIVYGLNGVGFYAVFKEYAHQLFKEADVDALLCTMTDSHAKYFKKAAKDVFRIRDFGKAGDEKRPMRWLLVSLKEEIQKE